MILTSCQINLYIVFFLIILLITLFYSSNNLNFSELFKTLPNTILPIIKESFSTPTINLDNSSAQTIFDEYISKLSFILNKYTNLDVPIIINNDKTICDSWGNYNNGKYNLKTNQCLIENGQRACLSNNNLVSCSNYYDANKGKINTLNKIDTQTILNLVKERILIEYNNVNNDIISKNKNINGILKDLISNKNLENQQLYFIEYNDSNINDKKQLVDKSMNEFEKKENDLNIKQNNFSIFLDQNINNDSKKNIYYKILIGIIITIVIVGILNFSFSEIL